MSPGQHRGEDDSGSDDAASELLDRWQAHLSDSQGGPLPPSQASSRAPKHAARTDADGRPLGSTPLPADHLADHNAAAREVMAAFGTVPAEPPVPAEPDPAGAAVRDQVSTAARRSRAAPAPAGTTTDVVFRPRRLARALVGLLALALLAATVLVGIVAYDDRTTLNVGAAIALGVVTLAVWAVRAGSAPVSLAIRSGQLEVVRGNNREVVDLRSRFTRVEVRGRPGNRAWKVLFERVGQEPLVVDRSMVDPKQFMTALDAHRPKDAGGRG